MCGFTCSVPFSVLTFSMSCGSDWVIVFRLLYIFFFLLRITVNAHYPDQPQFLSFISLFPFFVSPLLCPLFLIYYSFSTSFLHRCATLMSCSLNHSHGHLLFCFTSSFLHLFFHAQVLRWVTSSFTASLPRPSVTLEQALKSRPAGSHCCLMVTSRHEGRPADGERECLQRRSLPCVPIHHTAPASPTSRASISGLKDCCSL